MIRRHKNKTHTGGGDHLVVAHRAAGLDDAGGTGVDDDIQTVAEREEGIAGYHGTGQAQIGVAGLDG
ncbi:MAG: hypothetical protein RL081_34, partial [Pseudomonadota bacterium]